MLRHGATEPPPGVRRPTFSNRYGSCRTLRGSPCRATMPSLGNSRRHSDRLRLSLGTDVLANVGSPLAVLKIPKNLTVAMMAVAVARVVSLAAQNTLPVPPVKPGLWETKMSQLDANGREVPSPELAALSKMPPEMRDKMADAMRARGI